jgi:hypothetical protein
MLKVTQKDLEQAHLEYQASHGGPKEDYFALLYIMRKFNLSYEEVEPHIAFGGNDYGFDGFHFERDARNLYLYQFKWAENAALFKQSFKRLIEAGMDAAFGGSVHAEENPLLTQLRATIHENKALIERVFVHFVFNGSAFEAERSAALTAYREDLENRKYLVH